MNDAASIDFVAIVREAAWKTGFVPPTGRSHGAPVCTKRVHSIPARFMQAFRKIIESEERTV
jgi:hypothetical protein